MRGNGYAQLALCIVVMPPFVNHGAVYKRHNGESVNRVCLKLPIERLHEISSLVEALLTATSISLRGTLRQGKQDDECFAINKKGKIMKNATLLAMIGLLVISFLLDGSMTGAKGETPAVSMATDRTRYGRGETITLVVKNNLPIPVWYVGYSQTDLVFWTIERAKDNAWHRVDFRLPRVDEGKEVCRMAMYERPIGVVTDIKPHSELHGVWNQKICPLKITTVTMPTEPEVIERGKYRFVLRYSLEAVKSENIKTEPWKRPIELGETRIACSNEFFLE